jgi:hypothetical protein
MKGYRTLIFAVLSMLAGLLQLFGVDLPPDVVKTLGENIETTVGALMTLYGVVMVIFRAISDSPMLQKGPPPGFSGSQGFDRSQGGFADAKILIFLALAFSVLIGACNSIPVPKTFSEQLAASYASVAAVRTETANLLNRDRISVEQAEVVQVQADKIREIVDIAATYYRSGRPIDAQQVLSVTVEQLQRLESSLKSKGKAP